MKKTAKKTDGRTTRDSKAHKALAKKFDKLKKKARRNKAKHASLDKKYHNLTVHEYIDYDYVDQLSEKDKDWLNKFTEEEYRAYFRKDTNKHLNKKKDRKAIYASNNSRNRDVLARSKKNRNVDYMDSTEALQLTDKEHYGDVEDALIDALDYSRSLSSGREDEG